MVILARSCAESRFTYYIAVPYPERNVSEDYTYLFNRDKIESVVARGFEGEDEVVFRLMLADRGHG